MGERIRFHFDPLCPWAWQSSKWIREVQQVRDIEVEWAFFSLAIVNEGSEHPFVELLTTSTEALRTLALVRRNAGNAAVGDVYEALGERIHEDGEEPSLDAVRAAFSDAGFEAELVESALNEPGTMEEVRRDHDAAVAEVGAFGVPTIVLPSGKGMFGPVLSLAPRGDEAGKLWDHVRWLIDREGFFELKRERDRKPGEG